MTTLRVCSYNVGGKPTDASVIRVIRRLLDDEGVHVVGLQEMGDRADVASALDSNDDTTVLRKRKGGANRVALVLDEVQAAEWDVFPLPGGGDKVERGVAGNGRPNPTDGLKRAEQKFVVWADVEGIRIGSSHFIPSSANTRIDGDWKHPRAREVYAKQVAGCVEWFEQGGDVLLVDANGVPGYDLLEPLAAVADIHDAPSKKKPRRIDKVCVRKGSGIDVTNVHALDDVSSDHPAIVADLTLPQEAPVVMLTQLADVARKAGLKVEEVPGWKTRGRPASTGGFNPVGVLCHHTATARSSSDSAVVDLLVRGRSDLPGPLCQLGLGRDGTVYAIAAGRGNHAGSAKASGTVASGDGNSLYIGIEAFNDGRGEPWPAAQYDAYVRLCAALCREVTGNSAQTVRGHKETSVTGKIDPTFNMDAFRTAVAAAMKTSAPAPAPKKPARQRAGEIIAKRAGSVKRDDVRRIMRRIARRLRG